VVQFPPAGSGAEPLWHRTDTLDYNVVLEGELWFLSRGGEVRLGPGECVVVRGIEPAWDNRGEAICRLAAVSIAATGD
jgi:quercetin dioxygenase-like cupin family protein